MSLFADDLILYIENPKYATKKMLELINKFSKVTYKITVESFVACLYTKNELSERKIKKTIPLTVSLKRIKY